MPEPEDLEPRSAVADLHLAAFPGAVDVDFHRRLGEGEMRGAEAHLHVVELEERLAEFGQRPFEMAEMRLLVDDQALDLVEHRRVGLIEIVAEGAPRHDDADRRLAVPAWCGSAPALVWVRSTMREPSGLSLK